MQNASVPAPRSHLQTDTLPPTKEGSSPVPSPVHTILWLIRHGEVEVSYQRVFGGRIDMNLSPLGNQQASSLATFLHRAKLDALYASPMKRVQQTIAPLLARGAPQPVILPELREVDFGDWTGLSWDQVQERFGVSAYTWLDQLEGDTIRNAECGRLLRARIEPCLNRILGEHQGEQVAIFCHGGVIRMILSILLSLPLPKTAAFEVDYASVTRVWHEPDGAEIQLLNFAPWRELGLP